MGPFLPSPCSPAAAGTSPRLACHQRRGERLPHQRARRADPVRRLQLQGAGWGDRHDFRYRRLGCPLFHGRGRRGCPWQML